MDLGAVFLGAFVGAAVAKKFNQPVLTGYLLSGLLATTVLGRFFNFANTQILADLGLAFLMFTVGMDFSFRRLARVQKIAVFGALAQMILTAAVFYLFGHNLILAVVFSLSSTAIVVKLLAEKGQLDTLPSEIIIGWLLIQDLAVVPILAVMSSGNVIFSLLKAGILLYVVLILGKKVVPKFLEKVSQLGSGEVLLIFIVGLVLSFAALTNYFGLSLALGAFLAGLLLAQRGGAEIKPLRDVFGVIFFVTLGVLVSPGFILNNWPLIIKFVLLVLLVKFAVATAITLVFKYHLKTALQVGLSLTQVGEFAFVVARVALSNGSINQETYSLILAVTILTMMLTPWQVGLSVGIYENLRALTGKWSPRLYGLIFSGFDRYQKDHQKVDLVNHVVICGHGRVGRHITRILAMAGVPYVVVDYNYNVITELTASGIVAVLGDPTDREVLDFAGVPKAAAVIVAVPDRYSQELIIQNCQTLKSGVMIICRSHFEEDHRRLYALGVTTVVSPELEAAFSMSHRVLDTLGVDKTQTANYLKQARKEWAS